MRKELTITALAGLLATGCVSSNNHGTAPGFYLPMPQGVECCLGNSTPSPKEGEMLENNQFYNCAQTLYTWALESCSEGEHWEAQNLLGQSLQNLDAQSEKGKQSANYQSLKSQIELLQAGIDQQTHCR